MATLEPDDNTTFLAIGDVHGHWECVIEAIALAEAILGKAPDLVLQVGDAEPHRNEEDLAGCHAPKKYRSVGDLSALRQGDIRSPVYFIGGNHEPYVALDALPGPFLLPGEMTCRCTISGGLERQCSRTN
ncbi:metallophosphoesterase [Ferrimicrobium acidiphilum]|uniref:metallophosphoesterase n=1 Tax=Ferrimicrobium acidiphilum TaxID=121039 RepID=UPI0023F1FC22|nr:metallophosphoesterase [Ferrimicrobium acidiphilum]